MNLHAVPVTSEGEERFLEKKQTNVRERTKRNDVARTKITDRTEP